MLAIDKDLRDRCAAAGAADHLVATPGLFHQVNLDELDPFALQQGAGARAIGAPHRAVDLDFGHRAGSPKRRYGTSQPLDMARRSRPEKLNPRGIATRRRGSRPSAASSSARPSSPLP